MSQKINKRFTVIKFKILPQDVMYDYQCLPSSWIKCYNDDNQVTVAYPVPIPTSIDKIIQSGKDPRQKWPIFPAISIIGIDSFVFWHNILTFIEKNATLDIWELRNKLYELYGNNYEGVTPTIMTMQMSNSEACTLGQSLEVEDSNRLNVKKSSVKRLSESVEGSSEDRKKSRMNKYMFEREPQEPSSSRQHETPRQLNPWIDNSDRTQRLSESSDSDHESELPRQEYANLTKNSTLQKELFKRETPTNPKTSTSVLQIDKQLLVQFRKLCEEMNLILAKILYGTQEAAFER